MTIVEILDAKDFTVTDNSEHSNQCEYHFHCESTSKMYISGDVFGDGGTEGSLFPVTNPLEVMFCLAKGNMDFSVKLGDGFSFKIKSPSLHLNNK